MALVVINGMSGQQAPHQGCNGLCAGFKQKMKVVGKQSPGITARLSLSDQLAQPLNKANKAVTIFTVIKYFSAPDSASNDMVQSAWGIDACLALHVCFYIGASESCQL